MQLYYLHSRRQTSTVNMIKLAVVLSVLLVQTFAMTTVHHHTDNHHTGHHGHHTDQHHTGHYGHHTGPTHEPLEHENFNFRYDPHSLKMITAIDDTSVTHSMMTLHDLLAASKMLAHSCQHAKAIMKLN